MPRRAFPPDQTVRIAVAIQHVPTRAHLLPRLLDALGARSLPQLCSPWEGLSWIYGDEALRDPWATYRDCLRVGLDAQSSGQPTHLLVIQDDALPVPGFYERVRAAVTGRPGDLLCLYVPEHPGYMGRAIRTAVARTEAYAPIPGGMFVPLVAAVWPVWMAEECLAWTLTDKMTHHKRCDDAQVARFMRRRSYRPLGVAPSLVDHDEATPSTLGLGRYPRHAAVLAE